MKRLSFVPALLFFLLAFTFAQAAPAGQGAPPEDTFTLIGKARERGEISLEQATFFRLYALFGDERLPGRFRSKVRPKEDGTMLMAKTLSALPKLGEKSRQAVVDYYTPITPSAPKPPPAPTATLAPVATPPNINWIFPLKFLDKIIPQVEFTALLETAHFSVYYDVRGGKVANNANYASPAYAQAVADGLEYAWEHEGGSPDATHLGFNSPPATHSDGVRYEVYILNLADPIAGITPPRYNLLSPGSSYLFIDNVQGLGYLPELTAHEFNHASQYTYGGNGLVLDTSSYWYMEATATWVQFALFGDTDNWKSRIRDYYLSPENGFYKYSVTSSDPTVYGTVLFPKFLQERYGRDVIRASWEEIWNYGLIQTATMALHLTLADKGSTLSAAFTDFARANYLKRYPANEFAWPLDTTVSPPVPISVALQVEKPTIGHPAAGRQSNQPGQRIGPLGAHYLAFDDTDLLSQLAAQNAVDGTLLKVSFNFKEFQAGWTAARLYQVRGGNPPDIVEGPAADAAPAVDFTVAGFGKTFHQVVIVVDNASWNLSGGYQPPLGYEFRAEVVPITVTVAADKTGPYNKGDSATFTVAVKNAYQQLSDPGKLSATLTSPGTASYAVALTRAVTGTYTYQASRLLPGTYTLAASATNGGDTAQGQASITVERVLWLANGTPPGYYIPGVPFRWYVSYYQRDNLPPAYVRVYVQACQGFYGACQPQIFYNMQPDDPADTNYADGARFIYDMPTDPTGQLVYYYHFEASDGIRTVTGEDPGIEPSGPSPLNATTTQPAQKMLSPQP